MKPTATIPLLLGAGAAHVRAQKIFIDRAPGYAQLPPCAVVPLSTIVRNMEKGCGDGGHYTSFSCFCTASSARFASAISTDVAARCAASGIASQGAGAALSVFDGYCHVLPTVATTTAKATPAPATPAAANLTTPATSTPPAATPVTLTPPAATPVTSSPPTSSPAAPSSAPANRAAASSTSRTTYSPVRLPTAPVPSSTSGGARFGTVQNLPLACGAALVLAVLA